MDEMCGRFNDVQLQALKSLWNDDGIQAVYSRRGEYNLNDSTK
ncbi:unnamed protein product [Gongylonema pulchrum]|uniref:Uncharacterized protein n=1 Tax=Gongylonema pulchrum TaxID=637853 RepID=A0A3P6S9P7_9BILA|nr:unnamed protein product [Gongylonema pulchrum]